MNRLFKRIAENEIMNYNTVDNYNLLNNDKLTNLCKQFVDEHFDTYQQIQSVINNYMRIIKEDINNNHYQHALVTMRNLALNVARRPDFVEAMNKAYHIYDYFNDDLRDLQYSTPDRKMR